MNVNPKTKRYKKIITKQDITMNNKPTCSAKSMELTLMVSSAGELGGADGSGPSRASLSY
jgi:hypothetical protein